MKGVLVVAALLSPFLFPFAVTLVLVAAASIVFPPIALISGIVTDLAYYTPGASFLPVASISGLLISVVALFVRRFLKARIIGG